VKPLVVQILTKETRVSADKNYDVECRTSGSRPEAVITWWKANKPIKKMSQTVSVPCVCTCVCVCVCVCVANTLACPVERLSSIRARFIIRGLLGPRFRTRRDERNLAKFSLSLSLSLSLFSLFFYKTNARARNSRTLVRRIFEIA